MGKSQVDKGKAFERELVGYFSEALPFLNIHRSAATQNIADRSVGFPDLVGLPELAVEAKRTETINISAFMRQAAVNAGPGEIPVVIRRRNRQPTREAEVFLTLADFTRLYEGYLRHKGYTHG